MTRIRRGSASVTAAVIALALAFTAPSVALADVPSFQGLGGSSASTLTEARDVSGDGSIIVGAFRTDVGGGGYDYQPVRWVNGARDPLPMPLTGGYGWGGANAVSDNGAGIAGWVTTGSQWEAVRWYSGATERLGWLESSIVVQQQSFGYGITEDGAVVVGSSYYDEANPGRLQAIYSSGGTMSSLPFLGTDTSSRAYGVARPDDAPMDFVAVGRSGSLPCRWIYESGEAVVVQGLDTLGWFSGRANAISADTDTIVGYVDSHSGPEAVRWQGVSAVGLGVEGYADDVSGDGSLIVGSYRDYASPVGWDAFIFDEVNGPRDLQMVLEDEYELDLTGWNLLGATAVSADGTTIVGTGFNPDFRWEAWVATIPEPGTLCLVLLGGIVALKRRR